MFCSTHTSHRTNKERREKGNIDVHANQSKTMGTSHLLAPHLARILVHPPATANIECCSVKSTEKRNYAHRLHSAQSFFLILVLCFHPCASFLVSFHLG